MSDDAIGRAATRDAVELDFDDAAGVLVLFPDCVSRAFSIGMGNGKRFVGIRVKQDARQFRVISSDQVLRWENRKNLAECDQKMGLSPQILCSR